jgi:hypothetical protein
MLRLIARRSLPALPLIALALAAGCGSNCKCCDKPADKPAPAALATPEDTKPLTYEDKFDATLSGRVKAIDPVRRHMTIMATTIDSAQEMTFAVDRSVQRFNELEVGDRVSLRYHGRLLGELRAPTADEIAHPITYTEVNSRAPRTEDPSGADWRALRVVTTVQAVDVPNMLVTLRGPLGDLVVVKGRSTENLKRINRGDTIVITYDHLLAVSVDKTP